MHHQIIKPAANRILQEKWDKRDLEKHRKKLTEMKSSLDNKAPDSYIRIKNGQEKAKLTKAKVQRMQQEKIIHIDNLKMIDKISKIIDITTKSWKDQTSPTKNSININKKTNSFKTREQQKKHIAERNMVLLNKLQHMSSAYPKIKFDQEWSKNLATMERISVFKEGGILPTSTNTRASTAKSRLIDIPYATSANNEDEWSSFLKSLTIDDQITN